MPINIISACFLGERKLRLPYGTKSESYLKLVKILKNEITDLIRMKGVSEWYTGGQTGIEVFTSKIILKLQDEIGGTANLHMILPFRNFDKDFTKEHKEKLEVLKEKSEVIYIQNNDLTRQVDQKSAYDACNQYAIDRSDYLIAIMSSEKSYTGVMARKSKEQGMGIIIINPIA